MKLTDIFNMANKGSGQKPATLPPPLPSQVPVIKVIPDVPSLVNTEVKNYRVITTEAGLREYLARCRETGEGGFDWECAPKEEWRHEPKAALDPHKSDICTASIAAAIDEGITVPLRHRFGTNFEGGPERFFKILKEEFFIPEIMNVVFNLQFEGKYLWKYRTAVKRPCYDPMAAYMMITFFTNPTKIDKARPSKGFGLKSLNEKIFGIKRPEYTELLEKYRVQFFDELNLDENPEAVFYSCADSDDALRHFHYADTLADSIPHYRNYIRNIQSPFMAVCGAMEYVGMPFDVQTAEIRAQELEMQQEQVIEKLQEAAGRKVNPGKNCSTKDFSNLIFKEWGFPVIKSGVDGPALDEEVMIEWGFQLDDREEEVKRQMLNLKFGDVERTVKLADDLKDIQRRREFLKLVKELKKINTILGTHLRGRMKFVHPVTGRIHSEVIPWAETGRVRSRNPNNQNTPRPENDIAGVRKLYVAPPGYSFLCVDYSGFEMRILAWQGQCPVLIPEFKKPGGGDPHTLTAGTIWKFDPHEPGAKKKYKLERQKAKPANFGVAFGITAPALRRNLAKLGVRVTLEEAEQILDGVLKTFPGVPKYQRRVVNFARKNGYVETIFHWKRKIIGINSPNSGVRRHAENQAMNTPIQGSAACIMKKTMVDIYEELPEKENVDLALQVHDENVFLVPTGTEAEVARWVKSHMEKPIPGFNVPILAEPAAAPVWGEKKDIAV